MAKGFVKDSNNEIRSAHLKAVPSNFDDGLYSLETKEGGADYNYIDSNTTTVVKATPGILRRIYVWDAGTTWTIDIQDGAGNSITGGAVAVPATGTVMEFHIVMGTDITIITAGGAPAGKMLVTYD